MKQILEDKFEEYALTHDVRDEENEEVKKALSCKGFERGCFIYYCMVCLFHVLVPFGCNSKLCNHCAKRYTDAWADKLIKKIIPGIEHRHMVFSVPDMLWWHIKQNRKLQKILSDCATKTVQEVFCKTLKKKVTIGIISVVHPFGRDVEFKPHVHMVVTNGGYLNDDSFVKLGYVSYILLHKTWQLVLLRELKRHLCQRIIDHAFRKYPNGFAAYLKPEIIWSGKWLVKYLGRYLRHPAIANSRICDYDGKTVTFWFLDHKTKAKIFVTKDVMDFIGAVLQHVPEKNFKLIRYYGIYSRKSKRRTMKIICKSSLKKNLLEDSLKKSVFHCPKCSTVMKFIKYYSKPPDKIEILKKMQGVYLVRLPEGH